MLSTLMQHALCSVIEPPANTAMVSLLCCCRLSTVQSADQIVVMQNGRIAEKGTHNELLAKGGCYSELMSSQEMILGASV